MRNIRILIGDLTAACRALGTVRVVAAGSMYATLELDAMALMDLTERGIGWSLD